jgi:protein involved in polysaccharide export with SLBB domain
MSIADAINASGIDGVIDDKVRVTTFNTIDFMPQTRFYSLKTQSDVKLNPYDEVEVFGYYNTHILEPVKIAGEVVKPLRTYYEKGMNLQKLLDMAGGYNKKAYTKSVSILRYFVDANQTRQQEVLNYDLQKTALKDIEIKPYDEVYVPKILGWDSQDYETVTISGEVRNPKTVKYGVGLTLQDLIIMAGGLTKKAYTKEVEIVHYYIDANQTRRRKIVKEKLFEKTFSDIKLSAYDEVRIFTIPKWS